MKNYIEKENHSGSPVSEIKFKIAFNIIFMIFIPQQSSFRFQR